MNPDLFLVDLVTRDMEASVAFYRALGVEIPETAIWRTATGTQHVDITMPGGLTVHFDSGALAKRYDRGWREPSGTGSRIILSFKVSSRDEVDRSPRQAHGSRASQRAAAVRRVLGRALRDRRGSRREPRRADERIGSGEARRAPEPLIARGSNAMLHDRRRIMVIGSGGAGKSTFARELAELTEGLPLIHMDQALLEAWLGGHASRRLEGVRPEPVRGRCVDSRRQLRRLARDPRAALRRDRLLRSAAAGVSVGCASALVQGERRGACGPAGRLSREPRLGLSALDLGLPARRSRTRILAALREAEPGVRIETITRRAQTRALCGSRDEMANDPTEPIECAAIFVVRDIAASLAYFRDALGFAIGFTWGEPTYYAGVCRGAVTIHLQAASQTKCPPGAASLSVFVGSADEIHRELVGEVRGS